MSQLVIRWFDRENAYVAGCSGQCGWIEIVPTRSAGQAAFVSHFCLTAGLTDGEEPELPPEGWYP